MAAKNAWRALLDGMIGRQVMVHQRDGALDIKGQALAMRDAEIGYLDAVNADQRRQIRDLDFHLDRERRLNTLLAGVIEGRR